MEDRNWSGVTRAGGAQAGRLRCDIFVGVCGGLRLGTITHKTFFPGSGGEARVNYQNRRQMSRGSAAVNNNSHTLVGCLLPMLIFLLTTSRQGTVRLP